MRKLSIDIPECSHPGLPRCCSPQPVFEENQMLQTRKDIDININIKNIFKYPCTSGTIAYDKPVFWSRKYWRDSISLQNIFKKLVLKCYNHMKRFLCNVIGELLCTSTLYHVKMFFVTQNKTFVNNKLLVNHEGSKTQHYYHFLICNYPKASWQSRQFSPHTFRITSALSKSGELVCLRVPQSQSGLGCTQSTQ